MKLDIPLKYRSPQFHFIQAIKKKRWNEDIGAYEYFIKWLNWSKRYNTWQPVENLQSCPKLLEEFEAELARKENQKNQQRMMRKMKISEVEEININRQEKRFRYAMRKFVKRLKREFRARGYDWAEMGLAEEEIEPDSEMEIESNQSVKIEENQEMQVEENPLDQVVQNIEIPDVPPVEMKIEQPDSEQVQVDQIYVEENREPKSNLKKKRRKQKRIKFTSKLDQNGEPIIPSKPLTRRKRIKKNSPSPSSPTPIQTEFRPLTNMQKKLRSRRFKDPVMIEREKQRKKAAKQKDLERRRRKRRIEIQREKQEKIRRQQYEESERLVVIRDDIILEGYGKVTQAFRTVENKVNYVVEDIRNLSLPRIMSTSQLILVNKYTLLEFYKNEIVSAAKRSQEI